MTRLDDLIAEEDRLRAAMVAARERLEAAEQATLVERFKDDPQYKVGDVVLAPRTLFGKRRMWPARVETVRLNYKTGFYAHGEEAGQPWQSKSISYRLTLKRDGAFTGAQVVHYHWELEPYEQEAS